MGMLQSITGVADVLRLPPPSQIRYETYSDQQCADLVEAIKEAWLPILERRESWQSAEGSTSPEEIQVSWRTASFMLAQHFSVALQYGEAAFRSSGRRGWHPFLKDWQREILTAEFGFDAAIERRLLSEFCMGWWDSFFMEVVGSAAMGRTPVGFDLFVFWTLECISEVSMASPCVEHARMAHVLSRSLARRSREAVDRRDKADIEFRDSVWRDALSLDELPDLASRGEKAVEKYGDKNVESKFEESLNLLFQGLGFMVIPTRQGQRRVDMICISPGGEGDPYTILVEAKSSHRGYALPTKDARAVAEYVQSVRGRLRTLPPLRLVLIVGPEGAKTLTGKVKELDFDLPVPVRYIPAHILVLLRKALQGVIPAQSFLKAMIAADGVITAKAIDPVIASYRSANAAHSEFVSRLLEG
ncbi:hypothetical protein ABZ669_31205 [Streptomyces hirsutus]|uniref:hypothetical protein n=1 Tax=Streptomyces hirsutus TaxID=35620 RepID=UPI0033DCD82A